jgi:hypothetical protein
VEVWRLLAYQRRDDPCRASYFNLQPVLHGIVVQTASGEWFLTLREDRQLDESGLWSRHNH